jgi:hypothetical protein
MHEAKFNDAQYFLPRPTIALGRSMEMVDKRSFNEGPRYDVSSEEEGEEINSTSNPRALSPRNSGKSRTKKWSFTSNGWLHPMS